MRSIVRAPIGSKFGYYEVIGHEVKDWKSYALCRCVCGKERMVLVQNLLRGKSKSCRCMMKSRLTHGYTRTAEYQAWNHMKERCYNPNDRHYKDYGERGITVCDKWINDFSAFIADMGDKPSSKHSLDRKDGEKGYCPENCRWATPKQQSQNRRTVVNLTWNGETHCIAEWSRLVGINRRTIRQRINNGWSVEKALTQMPS